MKRPLIFGLALVLLLLSCGGVNVAAGGELNPNTLRRQYIVYNYYADWCSVCKQLDPELDKLEASSNGKIKVNSVNVDRHPNLAREKGIQGLPTLILSDGVQDIAKSVGYKSYGELAAWIHKVDGSR